LLGSIPSLQQQRQPNETSSSMASPSASIRTLRDQGAAPEDHQLYNGNALNFEPRRKEDEKEE